MPANPGGAAPVFSVLTASQIDAITAGLLRDIDSDLDTQAASKCGGRISSVAWAGQSGSAARNFFEGTTRMSEPVMTTQEVADALRISVRTLARWVRERRFPRPLKIGTRGMRWRTATVESWIVDREAKK